MRLTKQLALVGSLQFGISGPFDCHVYALKGPEGIVLIDAGANADARPEHLLQFAHMGSVFAEEILGLERPSVRLLSIGEEPEKGNQLTLEAHRLLREAGGLRYACAKCAADLGALRDNFKDACVALEREIAAARGAETETARRLSVCKVRVREPSACQILRRVRSGLGPDAKKTLVEYY